MNKWISKELNKVKSTKINFNDKSTSIFIPKTSEILQDALNIGDIYLIRLSDKITNPASNSTLASNWNAGRVPNHSIYKAELLEVMNSMFKFNGIGIEDGNEIYSDNWYGWIPKDCFEVIEKVEVK